MTGWMKELTCVQSTKTEVSLHPLLGHLIVSGDTREVMLHWLAFRQSVKEIFACEFMVPTKLIVIVYRDTDSIIRFQAENLERLVQIDFDSKFGPGDGFDVLLAIPGILVELLIRVIVELRCRASGDDLDS